MGPTRSGSICAKWERHFPSLSLSIFATSGFFCFSLCSQFRWQFLVDLWSRQVTYLLQYSIRQRLCQSPRVEFLLAKVYSISWVPNSFPNELCLDRASPIILMFMLPYLPPLLVGDGVLTVMSWRPIQTLSASRPRRPTFSYWRLLFFVYAMNIHIYHINYILYIYISYSDVECQPA